MFNLQLKPKVYNFPKTVSNHLKDMQTNKKYLENICTYFRAALIRYSKPWFNVKIRSDRRKNLSQNKPYHGNCSRTISEYDYFGFCSKTGWIYKNREEPCTILKINKNSQFRAEDHGIFER